MKNLLLAASLGLLIACTNEKPTAEEDTLEQDTQSTFSVPEAKTALQFAEEQYSRMMETVPDSLMPKHYENGELKSTGIRDWVSGFYPGTLWYLYEFSGNDTLKEEAIYRTGLLEPLKNYTRTHDLGFMVYCSFGNAYRITGNEAYKQVIIEASEALSTRFNETAGVIKSWDFTRNGDWYYPVIIDNMMNLEMLAWASEKSGNDRFMQIALTHSDTTSKYHFREDHSTYHVVDYDTIHGGFNGRLTHQGYADSSAWTRGQTWAVYGYTVMYRFTENDEYLERATQLANFILTHPNLPEDKVPYWDFDAPDIPNAPHDASAAAILASSLLELQGYVNDSLSATYRENAEQILHSLSSDAYTAKAGENGNFILMHSVGNLPGGSQVDVPLSYADYYYVEALLRYLALENEFNFTQENEPGS